MKKIAVITLLVLVFIFNHISVYGQDSSFAESAIVLETPTGKIYGTLTMPKSHGKVPVVLFIAGSGPTDRNGNSLMGLKTNCTLQFAQALAAANIASVRYDKRGIGESTAAGKFEADLKFTDFVDDAKAWIDLLKKDTRFTKCIVAGHSEGSLIGMIAAQNKVDKYISLAGAGEPADEILKKQLANLPENLKKESYDGLDSLKNGHLVHNVNPALIALLRPSVQPHLISWFQYDPRVEITKLKIPVLIVQGAKDLQVTVEDARKLKTAKPLSELVIIDKMNHIFKDIEGGQEENIQSYNNPELPINNLLINSVIAFIKK